MSSQLTLKKIIYFPLTKIIAGIALIVASVVLMEVIRTVLLAKWQLNKELEDAIVGIAEVILSVASYILLFRFYEKRKISELSTTSFPKNALIGLLIGLILQSLVIAVLYFKGGYSIIRVNPFSYMIPGFIMALVAGFVMELLIRGVLFRITEERLGTVIAIIITALLFAIIHSGSKGATFLSVLTTTLQAGILQSVVYVYSRNLLFPIFLHFAWDFAEPAIYGGINPGIGIDKSFFTSNITGSELLTGGHGGPVNSIQAALFCLLTSLLFLWLAKRKNNFIKPYWKK